MKNGLNFARKVLATSECDLLVLDEILGVVDAGVISVEELCAIIRGHLYDRKKKIDTFTYKSILFETLVKQ